MSSVSLLERALRFGEYPARATMGADGPLYELIEKVRDMAGLTPGLDLRHEDEHPELAECVDRVGRSEEANQKLKEDMEEADRENTSLKNQCAESKGKLAKVAEIIKG